MMMMCTIFGSGMTSKLFMNVREKLSLCYSIGAGYYSTKGILTVSAGIDFDKEEKTREEILRQLEACRSGEITPEELSAARESICSGIRAAHDRPGAIEAYYSSAGTLRTAEQYLNEIRAVTLEDVVAAAQSLTLRASYFLRGEAE
jgi:predicted Zn-dependent peptidase